MVLQGVCRATGLASVGRSCDSPNGIRRSLTESCPHAMEAGRARLALDAVRDAAQHEVKQLRRENAELKQLVGDLSLEVYRLNKTAIPMPHDATGTNR